MNSVRGLAVIAGVTSCALVGTAPLPRAALASASARQARVGSTVRVLLRPRVVDYGAARVSISGISAAAVSVRLQGADDPAGRAYRWTPYRWRRLRLVRGKWCGVLPAAPLRGVYQLQFQVERRPRLLQSRHWLLRVLSPGTLRRSAFSTPRAVIRDYVSDLPGNQVLIAVRGWPHAAFDHRDPRMHRLFVIAYAPRGDKRLSARRGLFITTVRDGYHGRWRLLQATVGPYD